MTNISNSTISGSLQKFYFRYGDRCPFCNLDLISDRLPNADEQSVSHCEICGWWRSDVDIFDFDADNIVTKILNPPFGIYRFTCVENISYLDIQSPNSQPVQLIRDYLTRNWPSRYTIHPRKLEEVVGSIYSSFGANVLVTSYSGDGGIDVLVERGNDVFGIQVKRYKNHINVAEIRELIGSLVVKGLTKGIFVTTSSFRRGARNLRDEALKKDISIELIDGDGLYSELINAQRCVKRDFRNIIPSPNNGHHFFRGVEDGACNGFRYTTHIWDNPKINVDSIVSGQIQIPILKIDNSGELGISW
jgi:restriction system protein